ncbi:Hypothetical protein GbCGDNIH2_0133 [Granulibacter bethesdensis]|uniref:DUF218 domain-containing protein n=2 Tax=Granulibacter bethesdensis TaxID=364410 RepID=Q0BVX1_GRABC|nr:YdcF family protein [Granulibacter bethesdensis]ABI61031.1 Hypothetical protein GbCGDNIH1_0133 [Granulibacter bethesdensis CGDNIH1]AHJ67121.1 Hypothetical protein GbCGDNIH2_0133 [Granulibacter bethesdensis]APH50806.1 Hypothetical protein GbCGDNIH5_0133 [Granulibacter bethesdensis]APH63500.1 Hypothetical protein GbCGDNIH1I4_0133 [Granulibacter bethesdensis]
MVEAPAVAMGYTASPLSRRMGRAMVSVLNGFGLLGGFALLVLSGGFLWFAWQSQHVLRAPSHADGIVVLTGGAERVATGLKLLAAGRGSVLLISGVAKGASLGTLARVAGIDPTPLEGRVMLGYEAATTRGNALETADWAHERHLRSVIVVTAGYHMPRALAELRRAMPDVILYPETVHPDQGGSLLNILKLLSSEYLKWLGAELHLSSLTPVRET